MIEDALTARFARYADLKPLQIQCDASIPQEALDVIYSRKLLPVVGLEAGAQTAVSSAAPIIGAAGITITLAVCPPGQGPQLHAHKATYETFTVLQGTFEFRWGESGEQTKRLGRFDTFSVPPLVHRAFRNVSDIEGILQVVISGGKHDARDIYVPSAVMEDLKAKSAKLYEQLTASGISSEAPSPSFSALTSTI
ncbi:MAG TPA: cupin domain-containing protein [Bryobacteraceae bacterium]|nr:cupin domain-containing protein [Bryobacteraceae bacterium]